MGFRPYLVDAHLDIFFVFNQLVLVEQVAGARLVIEVVIHRLLPLDFLLLGLQFVDQAELSRVHACIWERRVVVHDNGNIIVADSKLIRRVLEGRLVKITSNMLNLNADFVVLSLVYVVEVEYWSESACIFGGVGCRLVLRLKFGYSLGRTVDLVLDQALFLLYLFAPRRQSLLQGFFLL